MSDFSARYRSDYKSPDYTIEKVSLVFDLFEKQTSVVNTMLVKRLNQDAKSIVLNGEHLTLLSVSINGANIPAEQYQLDKTSLTLACDFDKCEIVIETLINPLENTALEGLYISGEAYCTQCEAEGFRRISYYLDRPDVMAEFTTKVIADKNEFPYLLANGNKIAEGDLPEQRHYVTWHDPFLKPCYLFALVAGDFDLLADSYITQSGREVRLEIFVDKGNVKKASHAMASLKKSMSWDEEIYGLEYDLDIYMIVAVDFFNMGAMENKGLNVFNSKYVLADPLTATDTDYYNIEAVIAHEYFHNWTGNRVTCRDWFQLSLKEGLTVFRDQQFSADHNSYLVSRIQNVRYLRSMQFPEDAGPMAHAIRPDKVIEMNNFYTLTVYEKGAEVIRMLHTLLGKQRFRAGTDLYFTRHDGQAVTCDDFVNAMADASSIDLTQFKRWYSQVGTPILTAKQTFDQQTGECQLHIDQQWGSANSMPLHMPINIELIHKNGDDIRVNERMLIMKEKSQTWSLGNFDKTPNIALLCDFSAPVKVEFEQSDDELSVIAQYANDGFVQWDAVQTLMTKYITLLMSDVNYQIPHSLITILEKLLDSDLDPAFKAEMLTLPTFDQLTGNFTLLDPVALCNALKTLKTFIATQMQSRFKDHFQTNTASVYNNSQQAIAKRALKNACLNYLTVLNQGESVVVQQYQKSDNMTDTLASLKCLADNAFVPFDTIMATFLENWQDVPLVMDKWFELQAKYSDESIFERLTDLLEHPLFSLQNPNRARALILTFSMANPRYFHCISGKGYEFLADQIAALNAINPQVASRLITPLIQYQNFDKVRQNLIVKQLHRLSQLPNLSKDLSEKLTAAL